MGEDRMERGGKRCYYEVLVKCFYWAGEKINEIDLSVGRNILFLFKSSIRSIDPFKPTIFLTLPTRPHCVVVVVAQVERRERFLN